MAILNEPRRTFLRSDPLPHVPRNTGASDLGYHYDPLDYVFGGVSAYGNLTFTGGTAIGWFNGCPREAGSPRPCGIWLPDSQQLTISGTATDPCWVARYDTVQESANANWTENSSVGAIVLSSSLGDPPARANARFTKWCALAGDSCYFQNDPDPNRPYAQVGMRDCQFYNGNLGSSGKPYSIPSSIHRPCHMSHLNP
jgi:hypothetical protein